jgi:hypothetical protein
MLRRLLPLTVALLSTGCVDVTEPVGDITKAEPNKKLLGEWKPDDGEKVRLLIERPEVKGNPKGLMRLRALESKGKGKSGDEEPLWFFTAGVGGHTYANLLVTDKKGVPEFDFSKEGEYAKWAKHPTRKYQVARVVIGSDAFSLDSGDEKAFKALMKREEFEAVEGYYKVPPGWLAKYLEKNGPGALFHDREPSRYTRVKK